MAKKEGEKILLPLSPSGGGGGGGKAFMARQ